MQKSHIETRIVLATDCENFITLFTRQASLAPCFWRSLFRLLCRPQSFPDVLGYRQSAVTPGTAHSIRLIQNLHTVYEKFTGLECVWVKLDTRE
jgi:hypothetical protein